MKKIQYIIASITAVIVAILVAGCQPLPHRPALTIALTGTSAEPKAMLGPLEPLATDHAAAALLPGDGKVTVVAPGTTTTVDLTPMRGREVESVQAKAEKLIHESIANLEEALGQAHATGPGLDVIGALDSALAQTSPGGRVVLITSGLSTIAPLDLNAAGDWISKPDAFVEAVNRSDLPEATGKHIVFAGLGYPNPASRQEQAAPAARTALTKIMLGLCAKMNAASCDAISGPISQDPSTASNAVDIVTLNQITTRCVGQASIDTSIAFDPFSSILLSNVDSVLVPIAEGMKRCAAGATINAIGHSALLPGTPADTVLEEARAQAVLNRLVALGAPASTIGTAAAGGQIVDNLPNGVFHEALASRNRTVVLTVGN